jgi:hypothetical protein
MSTMALPVPTLPTNVTNVQVKNITQKIGEEKVKSEFDKFPTKTTFFTLLSNKNGQLRFRSRK